MENYFMIKGAKVPMGERVERILSDMLEREELEQYIVDNVSSKPLLDLIPAKNEADLRTQYYAIFHLIADYYNSKVDDKTRERNSGYWWRKNVDGEIFLQHYSYYIKQYGFPWFYNAKDAMQARRIFGDEALGLISNT